MAVIPVIFGAFVTVHKDQEKKKLGKQLQRKNGDYPDNSAKIGSATLMSSQGMKRLAVTQTPVNFTS